MSSGPGAQSTLLMEGRAHNGGRQQTLSGEQTLGRQCDTYCCSFVWLTIDLESAAVPLDQGLGDKQSHVAAVMPPREDILDLDEGTAKIRDPFLGDPDADADAGVGDRDCVRGIPRRGSRLAGSRPD